MNIVKFSNGKEIPYSVCYAGREVLGSMERPTLNFEITQADVTLDELDALLSNAENLHTITLVNDGVNAETPAEKADPSEQSFDNYTYYARTSVYPMHAGEQSGYISFVLGQLLPIEIESIQYKDKISQLEKKLKASSSK